ncbi:MAG TPA: hypothetical protein VMY37_29990 [Thermoguttaceae bacterium]|nr:hypothetical protein [Thermoguttaceae bacterium]
MQIPKVLIAERLLDLLEVRNWLRVRAQHAVQVEMVPSLPNGVSAGQRALKLIQSVDRAQKLTLAADFQPEIFDELRTCSACHRAPFPKSPIFPACTVQHVVI